MVEGHPAATTELHTGCTQNVAKGRQVIIRGRVIEIGKTLLLLPHSSADFCNIWPHLWPKVRVWCK